jgi:hypothetical protein
MKESNLAASIDILARREAEDFITRIKSLLHNALKDEWRNKIAGDVLLRDDIKAVLSAYTASIGADSYRAPKPTEELVNACRATIIKDLLNGLPKIRELAMMQAEEQE